MLQYVDGRFFHFLYVYVLPISSDEERQPVAEFMRESILVRIKAICSKASLHLRHSVCVC